MKKVLSIDGGGIRGIIPAVILGEIERLAGKPCCELFDLIVGTSTGGILALGLTLSDGTGKPKYSADDLLHFYLENGEKIFSRTVLDRIRSGDGWLDEKYPAAGIEGVLAKAFGNARLKDTLVPVVITGYELEIRLPFFFKTRNAIAKEQHGYDFAVKDVARATSAAPTFFEPAKLMSNRSGKGFYGIVDGGVYANSPAMCAYVEAITHLNDRDPLLLSLGTGILNEPIKYEDAKGWGRAGWALPILEAVFNGVADTTNYQLEQLLGKQKYFRFQPTLRKENTAMDDASPENMLALQEVAKEMLNQPDVKKRLNRAVELLLTPG